MIVSYVAKQQLYGSGIHGFRMERLTDDTDYSSLIPLLRMMAIIQVRISFLHFCDCCFGIKLRQEKLFEKGGCVFSRPPLWRRKKIFNPSVRLVDIDHVTLRSGGRRNEDG
ncbi:hypothetical protein TNCT_459451 [Trichonephila clavata]|uniref:Uncharacterized protein n=1 Tax=Trichonephila clavata TaxID=2740835 RepID=A0A8X6GI58_TRICU|nr:hypothetical protein TNCT_459451 [Trichonephila clavata]